MKFCFQFFYKSYLIFRDFKKHLLVLNKNKQDFADWAINQIVDSTLGHIRYHFLDDHGPKHGAVTDDHRISVK